MNNYSIVRELGNQKQRKFSKVYLVRRNSDQKEFVLKIVSKLNDTQIQESKLRNESNIHVEGPHFQKNLDFWEDDKSVFLLKEFIPATTLDEWWKTQKKKSQLDQFKLIIQCFKPIFENLLKNQIAHNDIKPSNILVVEKDSNPHFILIDFGLAFEFPAKDDDEVLFALGYSAPELILSKKSIVNHSSDIFSLGILIYNLLTGKLPLSHPNPSIFTNLQITHPLINEGNIPKSIFSLIEKMCTKHSFRLPPNQISDSEVEQCLIEARNRRFQNLDELAEDLMKLSPAKKWWNLF
jgi:serine/threonine protein kinase